MRLFKISELEEHHIEIDSETFNSIYHRSRATAEKLDRVCKEVDGKIVLALPKYNGFAVEERVRSDASSEKENRRQAAAMYRLAALVQKETGTPSERIIEALNDPLKNLHIFGEHAEKLAELRNSTLDSDKNQATIVLASRLIDLLPIEEKALYQADYPKIWEDSDTMALPIPLLNEITSYCLREANLWAEPEGESQTTLKLVPKPSSDTKVLTGTESTSTSSTGESNQNDLEAIVLESA